MSFDWMIPKRTVNPLESFFANTLDKHHGHVMGMDEYDEAMEGPDCVLVDQERYYKDKEK